MLDQHLSRLAVYLRLLGLDALHRSVFPDPELARVSIEEDRVLLTRALYHAFWICPRCDRVLWEGPHVRRMRGWVEAWMSDPGLAP